VTARRLYVCRTETVVMLLEIYISRIPAHKTRLVAFRRCNSYHASPIIVDRKSKFQGRFRRIQSEDEIGPVLQELTESDRKIARASHPHIIAWRLPNTQGFKDNGESGAGQRLLDQVLVRHNLTGLLLIVTRWYGGTPLGGARFRHIINSAMSSLREGGVLMGKQSRKH
jgi:putative IMPACT (imprinted ancient) family translation regulator